LLWVTLVVLLLLDDALPVVTDAVPVAVLDWVAPPVFDWSNELPTLFPPVFALALWSVPTCADWSIELNEPLEDCDGSLAAVTTGGLVTVTDESLDWLTDVDALLLADAAPVPNVAVPVAVLVWPVPPTFAWLAEVPTLLSPLSEVALWSVHTCADCLIVDNGAGWS
jgi:hypothetical protein